MKTRIFLSFFTMLLLPQLSNAEIYLVNSYFDLPDSDPMDGVCDTGAIANQHMCSLRAAVMQANATQGVADVIVLPNNEGPYDFDHFNEDDDASSGDLDVTDDLTIINGTQAGATIDGDGGDRIFHVHPGSSLTLDGIHLMYGHANTQFNHFGGAALVENGTLITKRSSFLNNIAKRGGAIYAIDSVIDISDSYLHNNATSSTDLGVTARGSALFFVDSQVNISQSTFAHNIIPTQNLYNIAIDAQQAAIYGIGDESYILMDNSTVSHNHIGLGTNDVQEVNLKHSTVAFNQSIGMQFITGNHLYIDRSLFADNELNCLIGNIQNTTARTHSGSTDSSCQLEDESNIENMDNPLHSALNYWGGFAPTLMLYADSVAIDAAGFCDNNFLNDQRGFDRPKDGNNDQIAFCDMGAIEYDPVIDNDVIFKNSF